MIIVLIGLPGSGKGTHGVMIARRKKVPYLSVGDVLRAEVSAGTPEGRVIGEYMQEGKLIPGHLINMMIKNELSSNKYTYDCVLDGYPRNLEQAEFLSAFSTHKIEVIYFDVDSQVVIKRLAGRFSCKSCGKIYNKYFVKPTVENVCDVCHSSQFTYRQDDDEQTVKKRIEEYGAETYPLVQYYKANGGINIIDSNKTMAEVEADLNKVLKII